MKGFGNWMRQLGYKMRTGLARFMSGRYGTDKLNTVILCVGVVLALLCMFIRNIQLNVILTLVSYACMFIAIFRTMSRNIYKRNLENRRYLMFLERIKDHDHKYFSCPRCHQPVRVPKGKGKISITCPKCGEKFIRKS